MKLIHTADWHLGQNFFEYNRIIGEQKVFLRLLHAQIEEPVRFRQAFTVMC